MAETTEVAATVHVVVGWNDDYESAYLYEASPGEAEDSDHSFEADVPAHLWRAYDEASKADRAAHQAVLDAIGFDGGRMVECCAEWVGDVTSGHTYWSLVIPASGDEETWPLIDASVTTARARDELEAIRAGLPERFYVFNHGRVDEIERECLTIERGEWGPYTSACHRCGWERSEHPPVVGDTSDTAEAGRDD